MMLRPETKTAWGVGRGTPDLRNSINTFRSTLTTENKHQQLRQDAEDLLRRHPDIKTVSYVNNQGITVNINRQDINPRLQNVFSTLNPNASIYNPWQGMPQIIPFELNNGDDILQNLINASLGNYNPPVRPLSSSIRNRLPVSELTDDTLSNLEHKDCHICLSAYEKGEKRTFLPCLHFFHHNCINAWFDSNQTCPICKYNVETGMYN